MHDLRHAFRALVKAPGFALVAILTLALGIGCATTAFTTVNALLFRPFPLIQNQDRMLFIDEAIPAKSIDSAGISYADFLEWRKRTRTLEAIWAYDQRTVIIATPREPIRKLGSGLTAGAFQAMGVQPLLGRNFRPEENSLTAPAVAILGYGLWQSHFGGSADVLGQSVSLNGEPTTIIGVMPKGWRYPERADIWLPLRRDATETRHGIFDVAGHAMLKPGVTLEQARAEFAALSGALGREFPTSNEGVTAVLRPVREEAIEDVWHLTLLLFGAVMFVFLIACANVANLLLARASVRTREIAIRLALGATRAQLVRQLLLESLLLGVVGAVAGLVLALWGVDLMLGRIPHELPFWLRFEFDPRVFAFVAGLAVVASLLFGVVPALQASRPEVIDEIKEGGRGATTPRSHRLRQVLVVTEIALALVLLVGAGLMMRSFLLLHRVDPGFDPKNVLTFRVGFPPAMVEGADRKETVPRAFFREVVPRLSALPGVSAAGATSVLPGSGAGGPSAVLIEGQAEPTAFTQFNSALVRVITPGYFDTLRIPLKAGRQFTPDDDDGHPRVAIVDEIFATKFFPNQEPIGKRLREPGKPGDPPMWLEIVGVAGTARRHLDREEPTGTCYVPHAQTPSNFMTVVIKVQGDPTVHIAAARAEVLAVNKEIPIYNEMTFTHALERSESVWKRRFFGSLFTVFAGVALLLASIGIYGVMSYSVAQRTQEIGVRMALGAQPDEVIRMMLRGGLRMVALGLIAGFITAFFTAQLLAGALYGVSPHDPPTFAAVPALLALVALVACYVPSRRATSIDPMVALRME